MKTVHQLVNSEGHLIYPCPPYEPIPVELVSMELQPGTNDPEDPNDVETLVFTYRVVPHVGR